MPPATQRRGSIQDNGQTVQWRKFKGVNLTDARAAIGDDELAWLENCITVGNGAIQLLPAAGATIATIAAGVASLWGATLNGNATMLAIGSDGSITQVTPGGVVTAVAAAGTVTTSAMCTMWQGSRYLIIDPSNGYFTWDGTTFSTIDIARVGSHIAVFEGRVWIANGRTIQYTAPATYNDFTAGAGAGSTIITDEAFEGNVTSLHSALEQLWVFGDSAIEAIANVQASGTAPSVVTTFSVTNIVTNLGTNCCNSVIGYFRALTLVAPFGAYALSGVTPQKLSDKLDGLFPDLTLTNVSAAIAVAQSLPLLLFLVTYTGGQSAAAPSATTSLLLIFTQGKWSFGVQRTDLRFITTVSVSGVAQAWGCDSTGNLFQLFGAAAGTAVTYKIQSKLYDFGDATRYKVLMKVGIEFQAAADVNPSMTVDSELGSQTVSVTTTNTLTLYNEALAAAQRVTNGTFDSNLVGWTIAGTGGSAVWSNGAALLTGNGPGNSPLIRQTDAVTAGREHLFSCRITPTGNGGGSTVVITLLNADTLAVLFSQTVTTDGAQTITTTLSAAAMAGVNNVLIQFNCNSAGPALTLLVDNVSLLDQVVASGANVPLTILNALNAPLGLLSQGTVLSRQGASLGGRYLGWTLEGSDIPYRVQAVQFNVVPTTEWAA